MAVVSSFAEMVDADRRLVMLRLLSDAPGYALHAYLLGDLLGQVGHAVSAARLDTDLAWLAEQGMVTLAPIGDAQVATLTERGLDLAAGRARAPGIARPRPGE